MLMYDKCIDNEFFVGRIKVFLAIIRQFKLNDIKIDRTGITRHINNIYKDEELEEN